MKITEKILQRYHTGSVIDSKIVSFDLDVERCVVATALGILSKQGGIKKIKTPKKTRYTRYQVTASASLLLNTMRVSDAKKEQEYLNKLKKQEAKVFDFPSIKWVKRATSNFALMGKLPTEPYDSLVRAVRGNH
ncbi:hypothetical protein ACBQ20_10395 [Proteus vulgaris]|uniref:Uncharacterized protein n=1 Tax=Proteus vulgaris TaxID=585 RepID=A0A379F9S6_PROVU|nr:MULTISPECIES: hypothetical protein [Proteus]MBI6512864.1 hypothetical protein [Proteus sp. PR00174]SUC16368.1 Uncharacterised protein [Proteus vulgaris]